MKDERSIRVVPAGILLWLLAALLLQAGWHAMQAPPKARAESLPAPPPTRYLLPLSLGDPLVLSRALMLWLQNFDDQPGISLSYRDLDYDRVIAWLQTCLNLDPRSQYPLLAASRLYADIPVPEKQRKMLAFVEHAFLLDPDRRWQWLAHAVYIAKHRLGDLQLAHRYARELATYATGPQVPDWARQMDIFVLEDMGAVEEAKILLGGLIESGAIKDTDELRFLKQRLKDMQAEGEAKSAR